MNRVEQAEVLIGEGQPQAALAYAVLALVEEQQTTNELLRLLVAKDTAVEFDEGTDWSQSDEPEYTYPKYAPDGTLLCTQCRHSVTLHTDICTAVNVDGEPCGCKEFDDIPF